jgi:hypothetical protein
MTARFGPSTEHRRSRSSIQLFVQLRNGDRSGRAMLTSHFVDTSLQEFIDRRRYCITPSQLDNLTVEIVRLNVTGATQHALPRGAPDPTDWTDGVIAPEG